MSASHIEILHHALGIRKAGDKPHRNHFVTGPGSTDYDACESLVAEGLMTKRAGNPLTGGDPCHFVTDAGRAKAAERAAGPKRYSEMTEPEQLAWGAAESARRIADLADRTAEGLRAAQRNATARRRAIGASLGQAADMVILANRAARLSAHRQEARSPA